MSSYHCVIDFICLAIYFDKWPGGLRAVSAIKAVVLTSFKLSTKLLSKQELPYICDATKQNESELANCDFE